MSVNFLQKYLSKQIDDKVIILDLFFEGNTNLSIKSYRKMLRYQEERKVQPLSLKSKNTWRKRQIDFVSQGLDLISVILNFLQLHEVFNLHQVYKDSKSKKQTQNKIILYLTLSQRKFSINQQKKFLKKLVRNQLKISMKDYSNENSTWKQPINLDIQRTYVSSLGNTGFSEFSKKSQYMSRQSFENNQRDKKDIDTKIQPIQSTRLSSMSMKFSFLIFSCDDTLNKKEPQKKRSQNLSLKHYMRQVLNAISNRHPNLGYVQGLNCWIKHMYETRLNQEQAFTYACFLLQKMQAHQLFKNSLQKTRQLCYVFDIYLYNNLPRLWQLLKYHDVDSTVYASNWWITLFSQQLSKRTTNKLWHLFVLKGWKILIKFGIAIMCVFQQQIIQTQKDDIFVTLRNILLKINEEKQKKIWAIMNSIKVKNKMISYLSKSMAILSNDTEIQLWRLEHQRKHIKNVNKKIPNFQKQQILNSNKRHSLTTTSSLSSSKIHLTVSEKKLKITKIVQERLDWRCCGGIQCQKNIMGSEQIVLEPQDDYNILSLCNSVRYK